METIKLVIKAYDEKEKAWEAINTERDLIEKAKQNHRTTVVKLRTLEENLSKARNIWEKANDSFNDLINDYDCSFWGKIIRELKEVIKKG